MEEYEEVNINQQWQKVIFNLLLRLEESERFCREGIGSMQEHFEVNPSIKAEAQIKSLSIMITDFDILFSNIRPIIDKDFHFKYKKTLDSVKEMMAKHPKSVKKVIVRQVPNKSQTTVIGDGFHGYLDILVRIRGDLVVELSRVGFLFPKSESTDLLPGLGQQEEEILDGKE